MSIKQPHLLLAEDDSDDTFFFNKALKTSEIQPVLTTVHDGEQLITYMNNLTGELPDALFLDLNMLKKNGEECLIAIKQNIKYRDLPVIIYSTSLHPEIADVLYDHGAHFYIKKTDHYEMGDILNHLVNLIARKKLRRPGRNEFILNRDSVATLL